MNLFAHILTGELPADFLYQDEQAVAFRDVNPQAPVHFLVIPREPLTSIADAGAEYEALLGHLLRVAAQVAVEQGLMPGGYRVVTNVGPDGGQTVEHLHLHVLGGRGMGWPPG